MKTKDNIDEKKIVYQPTRIGWRWGALILVAAIGIPVAPLFFESYDAFIGLIPQTQNPIDPTKAGQFGDFVGGFIGTIAFIASVFVLYVSYQNQKATNRQMLTDQRQMIESQDVAHQRTTFEARFFELLKFHRENASEIEVGDRKSRRVFITFIQEWRLILKVVNEACGKVAPTLTTHEKAQLSFLAFFYGVGEELTPMFQDATDKDFSPVLVEEVISRLKQDKAMYRVFKRQKLDGQFTPQSSYQMSSGRVEGKDIHFWGYIPFDGHQSHLAHYYRHLGHVVKYASTPVPGGNAQDLADLIRAQLTTHEQALLALYAASVEGSWKEQNYLGKYDMAKNVPPKFFKKDEFVIQRYPAKT